MKKQTLCLLLGILFQLNAYSQQFQVSYPKEAFAGPFTGKVYLYLNKESRKPKDEMVDLVLFPCFAVEVKDIRPGQKIVIDDKAISFPVKLSDIERGEYNVQAVWDRNLGGRAIAQSPGNLYSNTVAVNITKEVSKTFSLLCDQVVPEPAFIETPAVKELKAPSALLTKFYGRPTTLDAAIQLPRGYDEQPQRKYPVVFSPSGYGGDHYRLSGDTSKYSPGFDTIPCITVYLDGNCAGGHSVYANSNNNGPWGDALVKEFIPLLESKFRCDGARLLWGHSSGGWTVLWLQTHYPSVFAGCWSSSPDPVDFRSFQKVNLYEEENMFYAKDSSQHMTITIAGHFPIATMKQVYRQENVIDRGEQMHSFNYVFSAKGANGKPVSICDPVTGKINKDCVEHWKQYDISAYLVKNWASLEKDLKGKIRISVGERDNFLLQDAVHLLEGEMKKLDSPFVFGYYPGDHFTVNMPEYINAGYAFLRDRYLQFRKQ